MRHFQTIQSNRLTGLRNFNQGIIACLNWIDQFDTEFLRLSTYSISMASTSYFDSVLIEIRIVSPQAKHSKCCCCY